MTDALVTLLADQPDVVVGVLAHEWGHVHHRHGMRMLVQAGLVAALAGLVVGDFSSLLATAPALLAQQGYSRDFERQADTVARQVLHGAGLKPALMVTLFDRLDTALGPTGKKARDGLLGIGLASHPSDDERRRFFTEKP
jgi:predicted Zn-dependent protease